ncbi:MAG: hypothetical protein FWG83_04805 [Oscillospiraceae bacterium]|nr:hypothetical protein [Oscillospiraceae bacterium]
MKQDYGALIGEFDTKPTDLLFKRLFEEVVLISLFVSGVFIYKSITDPIIRSESVGQWWLAPLITLVLLSVVAYTLFLKKTYKGQVFERGVILTNKVGNKVTNLSFDEIAEYREIEWRDELFHIIPISKEWELRLHLMSGKRISITSKNMKNVKWFNDAFTNSFDKYVNETQQDLQQV